MKPLSSSLKSLSLLLIAALLSEQAALAAPDFRPSTHRVFDKPAVDWRFPDSVAEIEDAWSAGPRSPIVYLFQDAHANRSGQTSLSRALEVLTARESDLRWIFMEGGWGDDSLSFLRAAAPPAQRRAAADRLLKAGLLFGEEHFDLASEREVRLWGVEDLPLYERSLQAYRKTASARERFLRYLDGIDAAIGSLKSAILNPRLAAIEARRRAYRSDDLPVTDYVVSLESAAKEAGMDLGRFPELAKFADVRAREAAVDFERASAEQVRALASLSEADRRELSELTGSEDRSPFKIAGDDREGRTSYYAALEEKLGAADFPALRRYFDYLRAARAVRAEAVLGEISALEREVFSVLAWNPDEAELLRAEDAAALYRKLFELKMTPAEYGEYREITRGYGIERAAGFLNKKIVSTGVAPERALLLEEGFESIVRNAEAFYDLTRVRDEAMAGSMLAKLKAEGASRAVLIAGGFHTANLKALLKARGVSFVCVRPRVFHETNQARYESALLGQSLKPDFAGRPMASATQRPLNAITSLRFSAAPTAAFSGILSSPELRIPFEQQRVLAEGARLGKNGALLGAALAAVSLVSAPEVSAQGPAASAVRAPQDWEVTSSVLHLAQGDSIRVTFDGDDAAFTSKKRGRVQMILSGYSRLLRKEVERKATYEMPREKGRYEIEVFKEKKSEGPLVNVLIRLIVPAGVNARISVRRGIPRGQASAGDNAGKPGPGARLASDKTRPYAALASLALAAAGTLNAQVSGFGYYPSSSFTHSFGVIVMESAVLAALTVGVGAATTLTGRFVFKRNPHPALLAVPLLLLLAIPYHPMTFAPIVAGFVHGFFRFFSKRMPGFLYFAAPAAAGHRMTALALYAFLTVMETEYFSYGNGFWSPMAVLYLANLSFARSLRKEPSGARLAGGHRGAVTLTVQSPVFYTAATAGEDRSIIVWNLSSRKAVARLKDAGTITAMQFVPRRFIQDREYPLLVYADDQGEINVWNWQTGKITPLGRHPGATRLVFAGDRNDPKLFLASASDRTARLWKFDLVADEFKNVDTLSIFSEAQPAPSKIVSIGWSTDFMFRRNFFAEMQNGLSASLEDVASFGWPKHHRLKRVFPGQLEQAVRGMHQPETGGQDLLYLYRQDDRPIVRYVAQNYFAYSKDDEVFQVPADEEVLGLQFGANGAPLVILKNRSGAIRVRNLGTNRDETQFEDVDTDVTHFSLGVDGTTYVTGSRDGSVQVWRRPLVHRKAALEGARLSGSLTRRAAAAAAAAGAGFSYWNWFWQSEAERNDLWQSAASIGGREGVRALFGAGLDWMKANGVPDAAVVERFLEQGLSENVLTVRPLPSQMVLKSSRDDGSAAVVVDAAKFNLVLGQVQALKSQAHYIEMLAALEWAESWGFGFMQAYRGEFDRARSTFDRLMKESEPLKGSGEAMASFMGRHRPEIVQMVASQVLPEYVEAVKNRQFIKWAEARRIYRPSNAESDARNSRDSFYRDRVFPSRHSLYQKPASDREMFLELYERAMGRYVLNPDPLSTTGYTGLIWQLYVLTEFQAQGLSVRSVSDRRAKAGELFDAIAPQVREAESRIRRWAGARLAGPKVVVADKMDEARLGYGQVMNVSRAADKTAALIAAKPDVLVVRSATKVTRDLIDRLPTLKAIVRAGHGIDNVDAAYARSKGILVHSTRGSEKSVSALALRQILAALPLRTFSDKDAAAEAGLPLDEWRQAFRLKQGTVPLDLTDEANANAALLFRPVTPQMIQSLRGKAVGIIGYGAIGKTLAQKLQALGMNVTVYSNSLRETAAVDGFRVQSPEAMASGVEFMVLLTGLYTEGPRRNVGMIDPKLLDAMAANKNFKALVNPDRGPLVNEPALAKLLDADNPPFAYFVDDIPVNADLRRSAVFTPHIAASTPTAERDVLARTAETLLKVVEELQVAGSRAAWPNVFDGMRERAETVLADSLRKAEIALRDQPKAEERLGIVRRFKDEALRAIVDETERIETRSHGDPRASLAHPKDLLASSGRILEAYPFVEERIGRLMDENAAAIARDMVTNRQIGTLRTREVEGLGILEDALDVVGWDNVKRVLQLAQAREAVEARLAFLGRNPGREKAGSRLAAAATPVQLKQRLIDLVREASIRQAQEELAAWLKRRAFASLAEISDAVGSIGDIRPGDLVIGRHADRQPVLGLAIVSGGVGVRDFSSASYFYPERGDTVFRLARAGELDRRGLTLDEAAALFSVFARNTQARGLRVPYVLRASSESVLYGTFASSSAATSQAVRKHFEGDADGRFRVGLQVREFEGIQFILEREEPGAGARLAGETWKSQIRDAGVFLASFEQMARRYGVSDQFAEIQSVRAALTANDLRSAASGIRAMAAKTEKIKEQIERTVLSLALKNALAHLSESPSSRYSWTKQVAIVAGAYSKQRNGIEAFPSLAAVHSMLSQEEPPYDDIRRLLTEALSTLKSARLTDLQAVSRPYLVGYVEQMLREVPQAPGARLAEQNPKLVLSRGEMTERVAETLNVVQARVPLVLSVDGKEVSRRSGGAVRQWILEELKGGPFILDSARYQGSNAANGMILVSIYTNGRRPGADGQQIDQAAEWISATPYYLILSKIWKQNSQDRVYARAIVSNGTDSAGIAFGADAGETAAELAKRLAESLKGAPFAGAFDLANRILDSGVVRPVPGREARPTQPVLASALIKRAFIGLPLDLSNEISAASPQAGTLVLENRSVQKTIRGVVAIKTFRSVSVERNAVYLKIQSEDGAVDYKKIGYDGRFYGKIIESSQSEFDGVQGNLYESSGARLATRRTFMLSVSAPWALAQMRPGLPGAASTEIKGLMPQVRGDVARFASALPAGRLELLKALSELEAYPVKPAPPTAILEISPSRDLLVNEALWLALPASEKKAAILRVAVYLLKEQVDLRKDPAWVWTDNPQNAVNTPPAYAKKVLAIRAAIETGSSLVQHAYRRRLVGADAASLKKHLSAVAEAVRKTPAMAGQPNAYDEFARSVLPDGGFDWKTYRRRYLLAEPRFVRALIGMGQSESPAFRRSLRARIQSRQPVTIDWLSGDADFITFMDAMLDAVPIEKTGVTLKPAPQPARKPAGARLAELSAGKSGEDVPWENLSAYVQAEAEKAAIGGFQVVLAGKPLVSLARGMAAPGNFGQTVKKLVQKKEADSVDPVKLGPQKHLLARLEGGFLYLEPSGARLAETAGPASAESRLRAPQFRLSPGAEWQNAVKADPALLQNLKDLLVILGRNHRGLDGRRTAFDRSVYSIRHVSEKGPKAYALYALNERVLVVDDLDAAIQAYQDREREGKTFRAAAFAGAERAALKRLDQMLAGAPEISANAFVGIDWSNLRAHSSNSEEFLALAGYVFERMANSRRRFVATGDESLSAGEAAAVRSLVQRYSGPLNGRYFIAPPNEEAVVVKVRFATSDTVNADRPVLGEREFVVHVEVSGTEVPFIAGAFEIAAVQAAVFGSHFENGKFQAYSPQLYDAIEKAGLVKALQAFFPSEAGRLRPSDIVEIAKLLKKDLSLYLLRPIAFVEDLVRALTAKQALDQSA